jgi:hypothetical protein
MKSTRSDHVCGPSHPYTITDEGWIRTDHVTWRKSPDGGWECTYRAHSTWMQAAEEEHALLDALSFALQKCRLHESSSAESSRAALRLLDRWRDERRHADALAEALAIVARDWVPDGVKVPMLGVHRVRRLPCDYCGEPCGDHTEAESQSCANDLEAAS